MPSHGFGAGQGAEGPSVDGPLSAGRFDAPVQLTAGSLIPAVLLDDIHSELPGLFRAEVTRDVLDTPTFSHIIIPAGAQILGSYDTKTSPEQTRLFISISRIRFPNGHILDLDAPGLDFNGGAGIRGKRQGNFIKAVLQGGLLNLVTGRTQNTTLPQNSDLARAAEIALGQSLGSVAEQHIERTLTAPVTFTVPAGTRFNVQLQNDYAPKPRRGAELHFPRDTPETLPILKAAYQPRNIPRYNRTAYPHWSDEDGDCQNLRHELLEQFSTGNTVKSKSGCTILAGRWQGPYSGRVFTDPKNLHIDHIVPLYWAHLHGAAFFSPREKARFANDPENLLIVSATLNQQKGAATPLTWMPPQASFHCPYILRFLRIVAKYRLRPTQSDVRALAKKRREVCAS